MDFSTLVEPVVSSYLYTNVYNSQKGGSSDDLENEDIHHIRGGYSIKKLYELNKKGKIGYIGGGDSNLEMHKQMDDYVVPIGLVYISASTTCDGGKEFKNKSSVPQYVDTIPEELYDDLIKSVAYSVSIPKTKKIHKKLKLHKKTKKQNK